MRGWSLGFYRKTQSVTKKKKVTMRISNRVRDTPALPVLLQIVELQVGQNCEQNKKNQYWFQKHEPWLSDQRVLCWKRETDTKLEKLIYRQVSHTQTITRTCPFRDRQFLLAVMGTAGFRGAKTSSKSKLHDHNCFQDKKVGKQWSLSGGR